MTLSHVVSGIFNVEKYRDLEIPIRVNHWPIWHRFRDRQRFQSKIANFPTPMYFAPSLKGFPLELVIGARGQKIE